MHFLLWWVTMSFLFALSLECLFRLRNWYWRKMILAYMRQDHHVVLVASR